jgi:hypothetical protein
VLGSLEGVIRWKGKEGEELAAALDSVYLRTSNVWEMQFIKKQTIII